MPSEPIVRDKYILYKNPKNFSLIENTVTIATVLKNLRKFIPPKVSVVISLFVELYKYNKGMKNFFYRVVEGDTVFLLSEKFSVPIGKLIKDNCLIEEISCGDVLYIEQIDGITYKVKPKDTLSSICARFKISEQELLDYNGILYIFYGLNLFIPKC